MKTKSAFLLWITLMAASVSAQSHLPGDGYGHFDGWYEIAIPESPNNRLYHSYKQLIVPVIKRGTNFYTPFVGMEVPMERTPEGLYLKADNSLYQQRAMLGYRPESEEYYARVTYRPHRERNVPSDMPPMTGTVECAAFRIDRPYWMPALDDPPPDSLDDYLGWYESFYIPGLLKFNIIKEDKTYFLSGHQPPGIGQKISDPLTPAENGISFTQGALTVEYNRELLRYEITAKTRWPELMRHPLVRYDSSDDVTAYPESPEIIGFPFGKD